MQDIIPSQDSNPKFSAQRCPVCNGHGDVNWGKQVCKACAGKGYLLIPNFIEEEKVSRRRTHDPLFK